MEKFRIERWNRNSVPNPALMREILESEGFRVFRWSDSPEAVYEFHTHPQDQSHWIISGALELTIENSGTYVLSAGDRDFMLAGTRHSARVAGKEPVVYLIGEKSI